MATAKEIIAAVQTVTAVRAELARGEKFEVVMCCIKAQVITAD